MLKMTNSEQRSTKKRQMKENKKFPYKKDRKLKKEGFIKPFNINNITMEKGECKVCGYEWENRVEKPKQCPKCKRYDWENLE